MRIVVSSRIAGAMSAAVLASLLWGCYGSVGREGDASDDASQEDAIVDEVAAEDVVPDETEGDLPADDAEADLPEECVPGNPVCDGQSVVDCGELVDICHPDRGEVCSEGACITGCEAARILRSNLGCEFWLADLDNAAEGEGEFDSSAKRFAVIAVNPGSEPATVTIEGNDAPVGVSPVVVTVHERPVSPGGQEIFLLDRREVDGSTATGMNDGTGSALTTRAYRLRSTSPVAVYQFNPLEEEMGFSADASMLVPISDEGTTYVVLGWPQTIAPPDYPSDFRAFVTVVGSQPSTSVTVELAESSSLRVLGDGGTIPAMSGGSSLEVTLGEFEVLNLETDGFLADFTGTIVTADKPVAVFSGSESSDVPTFESLPERVCCTDHMEEQLLPAAWQGTSFIAAVSPSRVEALMEAGGTGIVAHEELDYFRIMAFEDGTQVDTTLPPPDDHLTLDRGDFVTLASASDFRISADRPVSVGQFEAGPGSGYFPESYPAGDPSFALLTPESGWRRSHVFVTPGFFAFDFIMIAHPAGATLVRPPWASCRTDPVEGTGDAYEVTRCQLSFPTVTSPGEQHDGYQEVTADVPVGVVVYGFDSYVSYAYAAGMILQ